MATNNHTEILETLEFKIELNLIDNYINVYRFKKENAKSPSEKQKAKIMLNSLYADTDSNTIFRMLDKSNNLKNNLTEKDTTNKNSAFLTIIL